MPQAKLEGDRHWTRAKIPVPGDLTPDRLSTTAARRRSYSVAPATIPGRGKWGRCRLPDLHMDTHLLGKPIEFGRLGGRGVVESAV
ncbi:hypothetical protein Nans01_26990 [Nocardiopsis ansamitocini]|uniref:Uncharacterized protein n=1 Tax=Nocardiopsis ansamitocini TaxID=1670832 RepID=A0A9W6UJB8_9ACTN|nr:hypothetical protein Nans01_26990 [Nocardiopsis ansamitocini]